MLGHKFQTKAIADEKMELLNSFHGLPVDGVRTKFSENSYQQHPDGYYYMIHTEYTDMLGEPIEITLPTNNNE